MADRTGDSANERGASRPVFVSYASVDRRRALAVCDALDRRGIASWIAARDIAPGENYQEAIVRAIRDASALVLLFSAAANDSDEIKKELSLASRYRVPVIALRTENVEPTDAFAYELSTRQWIEAVGGGDAGIDALAARIAQIDPGTAPATPVVPSSPRRAMPRRFVLIAAIASLFVLAAGAWWLSRPATPAAHPMTVRLAGFRMLSTDLPATLPATVDAEIAAAFNADGVVGVSTAAAPPPGTAPAYALGGTVRRDGKDIRVITTLTNERSGATLWSETFDYDGAESGRVPRRIAVDAGNVVRCGLFGASTYRKSLPDAVLRDYLQFCRGHWDPTLTEGRRALLPAQRVVAAIPDFSWGWAAVAGGYWKVALTAATPALAEQARKNGRDAADRAIAIDPANSEALYIKAVLTDGRDWSGREALYKRAIGARRLDCGCEYHQYGWLLAGVGRLTEAVETLRQANDMLALYIYTPLTLADGLAAVGQVEEAAKAYDAAIDLAPDASFAGRIGVTRAIMLGDADRLADPALPLDPDQRAALVGGYRALQSGDAAVRAAAVRTLVALPPALQNGAVVRLLGALGANRDALRLAVPLAGREYPGPSLFWYPSMRGVLTEPGFPAVVRDLGLIDYWRASGTRPDVCKTASAPPFCRAIG